MTQINKNELFCRNQPGLDKEELDSFLQKMDEEEDEIQLTEVDLERSYQEESDRSARVYGVRIGVAAGALLGGFGMLFGYPFAAAFGAGGYYAGDQTVKIASKLYTFTDKMQSVYHDRVQEKIYRLGRKLVEDNSMQPVSRYQVDFAKECFISILNKHPIHLNLSVRRSW